MSKLLVLAEKPSVGRDLARVLNCNKKGNGFFEGDKYIVTWALGHLVTLADPEAYDEKYKSWSLEYLPMLPDHLKLVVIKQSGRQFSIVREQLLRSDVSQIVIATDAGREGELVARWIIQKTGVKKPMKRLWISSVTDKAIKEGFSKLKDGREYENLYQSAVARSEADWFVGINATRALTCKYNAQLSCGRVQTPTLAMIANREEEIRNFVPKKYFGITAAANGLHLTWQESATKSANTFNKEYRDKIFETLQNKDAVITAVDKSLKKTWSPQLYDLTELQRDANKYFSYSAKETLSIMQKLYEQHKVLTYPRTDSRYLSTDIVETLKDRLKACSVGPYSKFCAKLLRNPISGSKSFVDDSKVSDHHAIIPTEESPLLSSFSDKERKIYDLVVKRFLSVLYPPFEYEQTTIRAEISDQTFTAKGKRVISQGFREIYDGIDHDDDGDDSQNLPALNKGDTMKISRITPTSGETKPPAPFNEGTLLSAMENPVKYMNTSSKELIRAISEVHGIGTVATRADIIEKLFNSFLVEKRGKDLYITSKGKQLLELVPAELKSPLLTAEWEQKLTAISKGTLNKNTFLNEMRAYTKEVVDDIKRSGKQFKHENMTRTKCPECGKFMLEVKGKHGRMLVCQDRECGSRKTLATATNARCPECHKKLELHGEGESKVFVCKCGYREKLSTFNERKNKEKSNLSKKDVSKFLKEQNKGNNEPINSALAEALAKLKLQ
ncbi:MAG TPA: DNA topoisomerase III [Clostridiaceae bacterium]